MSNPRNATPEQDKYKGMRRMVFFIMILVPLIPFVLVLGMGYYYFTSSLHTNTLATVNRIVEDHRQMIDTFLRERRANLEFVLNAYSYPELTEPEKFYHVYTQIQRASNAFLDLGLFDQEGSHVMYQGPYRVGRLQEENGSRLRDATSATSSSGCRIHFVIALKEESERRG
jgi:two-component system NtrC family sensor kinase